MSEKGKQWNESEVVYDPLTLRKKRRITSSGQYNLTPTYHTGALPTELLPNTRQAVFAAGNRVTSVHLDSLEDQVLLEFDEDQVSAGSSATPDEDFLSFTFMPAHLQIVRGGWYVGVTGTDGSVIREYCFSLIEV